MTELSYLSAGFRG